MSLSPPPIVAGTCREPSTRGRQSKIWSGATFRGYRYPCASRLDCIIMCACAQQCVIKARVRFRWRVSLTQKLAILPQQRPRTCITLPCTRTQTSPITCHARAITFDSRTPQHIRQPHTQRYTHSMIMHVFIYHNHSWIDSARKVRKEKAKFEARIASM